MVNLHISLTPFTNESRVIKQTNSLVKNNVFEKIYIVALSEVGLPTSENLTPNIEVYRIVLKTRRLSKVIFGQLIKYIELSLRILYFSLKVKPKVVNVHSLPLLPLGCLIKLFSGAGLVYDTHELETETDGLRGLRQQLARIVEKFFIRYVNGIVVVGNEIRNWYIEEYKCKNIVTVLNCPNYIEKENLNLIRKEFGIEPKKKIILYLGVISEGRGVRYLLEAFNALDDDNYVMVFIGYGDLEMLVSDFSIKNKNIYLRKAVKPDEVIQYAASADIGVSIIEDSCLSYNYCLPNKLFEYIMAGIPIIISNLPEMRRIVQQYKIGVVIPGKEVVSLKHALRQIDRISAKEIKLNLNRAAKELNWENQEKFYIKIIAEVIKKRIS